MKYHYPVSIISYPVVTIYYPMSTRIHFGLRLTTGPEIETTTSYGKRVPLDMNDPAGKYNHPIASINVPVFRFN